MSIFVIRAKFGQFTNVFREHGYVGIGWLQRSLSTEIKARRQQYEYYRNKLLTFKKYER